MHKILALLTLILLNSCVSSFIAGDGKKYAHLETSDTQREQVIKELGSPIYSISYSAPTKVKLTPEYHKHKNKFKDPPKVLIIGDSISIGYTPHVKQMLKGKAVVIHHKGNAQHTGTGLRKLDGWLGGIEWDVIHCNWGLWDLCYRSRTSKVQGRRDKTKGKVTTTLEQYEKNLEQLVARLKKTKATLIWAHTTVVPEMEAGRIVGDDKKYNDVAAKIMKKHGVTINDLHSLTKDFSPALFVGVGDVHYKKEGYKKIGQPVASIIQKAIDSKP